jgi:hypothetical protein
VTIRGLNKDHNHDLKGLFKAAATRANVQPGPFQDFSREKNVLDIPSYRSDGMRRPVSERDAVRSQVIDVLEAQEIKETGDEED